MQIYILLSSTALSHSIVIKPSHINRQYQLHMVDKAFTHQESETSFHSFPSSAKVYGATQFFFSPRWVVRPLKRTWAYTNFDGVNGNKTHIHISANITRTRSLLTLLTLTRYLKNILIETFTSSSSSVKLHILYS